MFITNLSHIFTVFLFYLNSVSATDILDILGNKIPTNYQILSNDDLRVLNFTGNNSPTIKLITKHGYPVETHELITEDGYILTCYRIPKPGRKVVLFTHALTASSSYWVIQGPNKDLAFMYADRGYDVWLMNTRGVAYSRKHIHLNPDYDQQFWDYSFYESGYYDVPATIDYILTVTNQRSVIHIGHSLGSMTFFVMCALRPEYNSKVSVHHAFAPAMYARQTLSPFMQFAIANMPNYLRWFQEENVHEIFAEKKLFRRMLKSLCNFAILTRPSQFICQTVFFLVGGFDYQQMNVSFIPKMLSYVPSTVSLRQMQHFYQLWRKQGLLQLLDFGEQGNLMKYKTRNVPQFNLKNIVAPVAIYVAEGDSLVKPESMLAFAKMLPNVDTIHRIPHRLFNHFDFIFAEDSKRLLYDKVLEISDKYRNEL